jgi:hypothetical protein
LVDEKAFKKVVSIDRRIEIRSTSEWIEPQYL